MHADPPAGGLPRLPSPAGVARLGFNFSSKGATRRLFRTLPRVPGPSWRPKRAVRARWWMVLLAHVVPKGDPHSVAQAESHIWGKLMSIARTRRRGERGIGRAAVAYTLALCPGMVIRHECCAGYVTPRALWFSDSMYIPEPWLAKFRWVAALARPPVAVLLGFWQTSTDRGTFAPWLAARLPPDIYAAGR